MSLFQDSVDRLKARGPTLDTFLPYDTTHPAVVNHQGLRLFACSCADRVQSLLTDPWIREAIEAGRSYARGECSFEKLQFAFALANSIKGPFRKSGSDYAAIAATSCALTEVYAGPRHNGRGPEWSALAAARIGSCAARMAEQIAWGGTEEEIEEIQMELLRRYVPECFPRG